MFEITQEAKQETDQALTIVEQAEYITVKDAKDYEHARRVMKEIKARLKELDQIRKGQTGPLDQAKKKIMDFFREPKKRLEDAKAKLNTAMVNWAQAQEIRRRAEEPRIQKEAEDKALAEAEKAAEAGDKEAADKVLEEAANAKPVKVEPAIQTSKESHIRETWSAEVVDLMALVRGVASGEVNPQAVSANTTFLNSFARVEKQNLNIPGVKAVSKKTQI